jgi:hypothetical protein
MTRNVESQTDGTALESEILVILEAREALPEDSHLRALCSLAAERLGDFVSQPQAIDHPLQPDVRYRRSA